MKRCFSVLLLLALFSINMWSRPSAAAQGGVLGQVLTLESDAGNLTMQFPVEWHLNIPQDSPLPYAVMDNGTDTFLPTAVVEAIITSPADIPFEFDAEADNPAETYFEAFKQQRIQEQLGVYGQVLPALFGPSVDPYPGAMMMLLEKGETNFYLNEPQVISLGVSIALAEDIIIILSFQSRVEDFEAWRPTWLGMLDTLKWNDISLMNSTTRTRTANLENGVTMISLYNTMFPPPSNPAINTPVATDGNPIDFTVGSSELRFPPPLGWQYITSQDSSLMVITPTGPTSVFIAIRFVPTDTDYGAVALDESKSNIAIQLQLGATLVKQVREIMGGGVYHVVTFEWGGFPAAGISYVLPTGTQQLRYALVVGDGLVEITLQASLDEWQQVKFEIDFLLSRLTLNGTLLNSEAAESARQSLAIQ